MKKALKLLAVAFVAMLMFSACDDEDFATEIAGTYTGYNDLKLRTTAKVYITREDNTTVRVSYDTDIDDKAPTESISAKVTKSGDNYKISGKSGVESIDGTVDDETLTLSVKISGSVIYKITAQKN